MICTVTLNASIDKAYQLERPLVVGEVQRVAACADFAGGKGLNVARSVHTCGEEVLATGFVGGHVGHMLCDLLAADGITADFVHVAAETRCCINVLEPDGRSTELLEPGRPVSEVEYEKLCNKLSEIAPRSSVITFSGSVPKGLPQNVYAELILIAQAAGVPTILDTSGAHLVAGIKAKPTLVKPNADEIYALLGARPEGLAELVLAARQLHRRGIKEVVVSLGGSGALMSCDEGTFRGTPPRIEVKNPVGSGDTMVGAFAVAMARGMAAADQLRFAMAAATANCLTPETGHFELESAEELLEQISIERLA